MCFGGGGSPPKMPTPPPAATPPTMANPEVQNAGGNTRARAAAAAQASGQNPTGPRGLSAPPVTANATLLGQ